VPVGHALALQLEHVDDFARRCPEQFAAIVECAALVNWRRIEQGYPAVLALSFFKQAPEIADQPLASLFTGRTTGPNREFPVPADGESTDG
jgi:hypothetical protein